MLCPRQTTMNPSNSEKPLCGLITKGGITGYGCSFGQRWWKAFSAGRDELPPNSPSLATPVRQGRKPKPHVVTAGFVSIQAKLMRREGVEGNRAYGTVVDTVP